MASDSGTRIKTSPADRSRVVCSPLPVVEKSCGCKSNSLKRRTSHSGVVVSIDEDEGIDDDDDEAVASAKDVNGQILMQP